MILLLDLGNTRLKWCVVDPKSVPDSFSVSNSVQCDSVLVDTNNWEQQLQAAIGGLHDITRIVLASVACRTLTDLLQNWCECRWGTVHRLHTALTACGVSNGYRDFSQMGVDRWLAVLGAWVSQPQQALCIVDAGSAITIDCLDAKGRHHGGVILSGTREVSELFPDHKFTPPNTPFGKSTGECLALGRQLQKATDPLQWLLERIEATKPGMAPRSCFVVTGGNAEAVAQAWGMKARHVSGLVFMGMLAVVQSQARR